MTTPVPASVWRLAALVAFGGVLAGLDSSVANVGLDAITQGLDTSLASSQWITSGYLLALAAALPACGWLSRRFGAGRLWSWSLAGFTVASALCALATTAEVLIAFRVVQGLFGGLMVPAGMTIVAQAAGPSRMGRVLSTSAVPAILAPAIGPPVGSLIIANGSWPWLFLINVPIGIVALLIASRLLPRGERTPSGRIDVGGLLLVGTGLPLLIYGITEAAQQRTVVATAVALPLVLGIGALATFTRRALRRDDPLLDLRLLRNRTYAAASFEVLFNGAALAGGMIVMPLLFLFQRGTGIVETGLLLMAFSLGAAATFPVAGRLSDRFGGGRVTVAGLLLTLATTIPFALLPADADLVVVEALQVLRGIGLALSGMPAVSAALATVRHDQVPDATAQVNILSRVGGALGSAVFVVILTAALPAGATGAATTPAFHATFWWMAGSTLAALGGAAWLVIEQRRSARVLTAGTR
ncbi:DHA2 family efflux MFS transporter permease subunit [Pseudonocardia sp. GCM10023141]|uniref:DHA2 family efflux MFS transporter permease subunit n=1 Tax=Pseudonocardia sp. GCM10023141 TaxID=3252653 RepID=UPI00360B2336